MQWFVCFAKNVVSRCFTIVKPKMDETKTKTKTGWMVPVKDMVAILAV